jgi:hypothetical protein
VPQRTSSGFRLEFLGFFKKGMMTKTAIYGRDFVGRDLFLSSLKG